MITLGVLVVVLVLAAASNIKPKPKANASKTAILPIAVKEFPITADQGKQAQRGAIYVMANAEEIKKQKDKEALEWKRDPFFRSGKNELTSNVNLQLKGVSLGKGRGFTFINDQILTVGDSISGYKIAEIERNKVLLQKGLEHFYLVLPEEGE